MAEDDFEALPKKLQLKIDAAFDASLSSKSGGPPPKKRRKQGPSPSVADLAGGFIIDEAPGGFMRPSEEEEDNYFPSEDDVIPFFRIPTALQKLDLPPDDEEVLEVFRNAARGWSSVNTADYAHDAQTTGIDGAVSRSDFRAVCAVVVSSRVGSDAGAQDATEGFVLKDKLVPDPASGESSQEMLNDEDVEEDAYTEEETEHSSWSSSPDPENDTDPDEYLMGTTKSRTKSITKSHDKKTRPEPPGAPTPRQRRTALETYSLFFPSSSNLSDEDLAKARLRYKDIVRVTDILKERIKADEITEMLSLFSTSPDLSMGFEDFIRMMLMAKLA